MIPSFGVEVLRVASRADEIRLHPEWAGECALEVGEKIIHTDKAGGVWRRYAPSGAISSLPAHRVLSVGVDKAIFRDRIVLIGASAPGLSDAFETPLQRLQAGVSIQAQLVDSLLAVDLLWRPTFAPALERLLAILLGIAAMLQFVRASDGAYALLSAGAAVLLVAGSLLGTNPKWTFADLERCHPTTNGGKLLQPEMVIGVAMPSVRFGLLG